MYMKYGHTTTVTDGLATGNARAAKSSLDSRICCLHLRVPTRVLRAILLPWLRTHNTLKRFHLLHVVFQRFFSTLWKTSHSDGCLPDGVEVRGRLCRRWSTAVSKVLRDLYWSAWARSTFAAWFTRSHIHTPTHTHTPTHAHTQPHTQAHTHRHT